MVRKVIIADDEAKVCQLINHLIDWQQMNMEVVAIVNDGKVAYEEICEKKPDIVITDIRMPTYDGIELIRRTKEILPNVYFIIVSGYNHFEYAQSAIKYGAEDYLLKPLKKKELESTLTKIVEKDNQYLSEKNEKIQLKARLHNSEEKNKRNLMIEILMDKDNHILQNDIAEINKEYACHFENGYYYVLKIRPYIQSESKNIEMLQLLLNKLQHMFDEMLQEISLERVSAIWQKSVICMVNTDENLINTVVKRINRMKIDIMKLNDIFDKIDIVIGMSEISDSISSITSGIQEAQFAIMNRVTQENPYIIMGGKPEKQKNTQEKHILAQNFRTNFLGYFERLDMDKIENEIRNIEVSLVREDIDGERIFHYYEELVATLCFGAKNFLQNYQFPELSFFMERYDDMLSLPDIFDWMVHFVKQELEQYAQEKRESDSKPIRQAKQYIHERYNQSLSLESVSNVVGFNPAYFSTLFKKETGKNFMEYIIEIRIQNAKQFLTQTNMDIMDIASEVGYSDLKYFSKIFKKVTGINPSEYRRLYG